MPGPSKTLLIEGSFTELAEEFAQYIDNVKKNQNDDGSTLSGDIAQQLETLSALQREEQDSGKLREDKVTSMMNGRVEVMKALVTACPALNSAPEKEFTAAYNLLIHLIYQTPNPPMFLPRICHALSQPITSSPQHGPSLALTILTTIFNTLPADNSSRYHVLLAIISVLRANPTSSSTASAFEALKPSLSNSLPTWLASWEVDDEDARKLHIAISQFASEAGYAILSYNHILLALETIPPNDSSSPEARSLAVRGLTTALIIPSMYDFHPLTASDSIQALRRSDPLLFELLEIFASDTLDTYEEFISQDPNPLSNIPALSSPTVAETLKSKIRLLTLASLAASTPSRSLPYSSIAEALRIDIGDVEKWVIDTIRAGLVEGKLSQLKKEFLVQRATYRVFGEKQWSELQGRLMVWRRSLEGVLSVIRTEREKAARELASGQISKENGAEDGDGDGRPQRQQGGGRGGRRGGGARDQAQRKEVDYVGAE